MDALATLWRRLRAEAERAAASPAERLLDDVLQLLEAPGSSDARKREVRREQDQDPGSRPTSGQIQRAAFPLEALQVPERRVACPVPREGNVQSQ